MKTIKEMETLIKMLKKQGVFHYRNGDMELKITPPQYQQSIAPVKNIKEVNEEDLYYSATILKPKAR